MLITCFWLMFCTLFLLICNVEFDNSLAAFSLIYIPTCVDRDLLF
uniref:Uncharacterized protein n=1 Tax=Arundo donax TaxID=35708 RepID=A0A0A9FR35_ARUDO